MYAVSNKTNQWTFGTSPERYMDQRLIFLKFIEPLAKLNVLKTFNHTLIKDISLKRTVFFWNIYLMQNYVMQDFSYHQWEDLNALCFLQNPDALTCINS